MVNNLKETWANNNVWVSRRFVLSIPIFLAAQTTVVEAANKLLNGEIEAYKNFSIKEMVENLLPRNWEIVSMKDLELLYQKIIILDNKVKNVSDLRAEGTWGKFLDKIDSRKSPKDTLEEKLWELKGILDNYNLEWENNPSNRLLFYTLQLWIIDLLWDLWNGDVEFKFTFKILWEKDIRVYNRFSREEVIDAITDFSRSSGKLVDASKDIDYIAFYYIAVIQDHKNIFGWIDKIISNRWRDFAFNILKEWILYGRKDGWDFDSPSQSLFNFSDKMFLLGVENVFTLMKLALKKNPKEASEFAIRYYSNYRWRLSSEDEFKVLSFASKFQSEEILEKFYEWSESSFGEKLVDKIFKDDSDTFFDKFSKWFFDESKLHTYIWEKLLETVTDWQFDKKAKTILKKIYEASPQKVRTSHKSWAFSSTILEKYVTDMVWQ